jgi:hypothetical protein
MRISNRVRIRIQERKIKADPDPQQITKNTLNSPENTYSTVHGENSQGKKSKENFYTKFLRGLFFSTGIERKLMSIKPLPFLPSHSSE